MKRLFRVKYLSAAGREITVYRPARTATEARQQLVRNGIHDRNILSTNYVADISDGPGIVGIVR